MLHYCAPTLGLHRMIRSLGQLASEDLHDSLPAMGGSQTRNKLDRTTVVHGWDRDREPSLTRIPTRNERTNEKDI
jgi:hypothetical protein